MKCWHLLEHILKLVMLVNIKGHDTVCLYSHVVKRNSTKSDGIESFHYYYYCCYAGGIISQNLLDLNAVIPFYSHLN